MSSCLVSLDNFFQEFVGVFCEFQHADMYSD